MSKMVNRTWYKGFYAYWFKECGSLNYLIPMLIGVIVSVLVMIKGLTEALPFTICFTSICAFASVSWQSIRLQATEWHSLVPGYTEHIVKQGNIIIVAPHVILITSAIILGKYDVLKLLSISVLIGTLFYLKCRVTSKMFNSSAYFFFTIIGFTVVVKEVPTWLATLAVILTISLVLFRKRFGTAFKWQAQALVDYKHALQSGWSPIPKGFLKGYGQGLNKFFFPLSYFMGRSLIQYTVLVLVIFAALLTLNYFYVTGRPSLFIFSNLVCILAFMILWTRIQRQQAWGTLITLPIYSSVSEAKTAYAKACEKYALCIFICSLALAGLIEILRSDELNFRLTAAYALVNTAGVLICFTVGNYCKKTAFFSVALVFTVGAALAIAGAIVTSETISIGYLALASCYFAVAILGNRYSSKHLYTNI